MNNIRLKLMMKGVVIFTSYYLAVAWVLYFVYRLLESVNLLMAWVTIAILLTGSVVGWIAYSQEQTKKNASRL